MEDHHCHNHPHFTLTCEECRRARAAFQPYQNVDPHPEPASRSYQRTLGPAFVVNSIGIKEAVAYGVAEGVVEGVTDSILDSLLGR